jgi:ATP-dependent DNA helicase RecG
MVQRSDPDVVVRRSYGLELFAPPRARHALAVGGRRARGLARLGIESVQDLLQHYPRYHIDRSELSTVRELAALASRGHSGEVTVHARVVKIERPFRTRGRVLVKGRIADETGSIDVTWFNQEWVARALPAGAWA